MSETDRIEERLGRMEARMGSEVPMQEIDRYFRHEATDDVRWLIAELRKAREDGARIDRVEATLRDRTLDRTVVVLASWWSDEKAPDGFSVEVGDLATNPAEWPTLRDAIDDEFPAESVAASSQAKGEGQ